MLFLLASVVVFNVAALWIPKRLSRLEMWTNILFAAALQLVVDMYLDVKLQLYGYFNKGVDWGFLIAVCGIYPAVGTMFLNYYPLHGSLLKRTGYILGWTVASLLYEFASLKSGYFYYDGWRIWYSAMCYPLLLGLLVWHLRFIRRLKR
ncbi:CBO0543 family protein [Alicyclobacillus ferrooxydans]|uniref:Uncharacterized protein n=1 Tax=Alicyclobacillus ferrooxydans TaxID=471514 RepID=A0A0P9GNA6_9BACL|nr:CBO0543 family protein [Alicyclobacillus ferrooxydans]KPV41960.1 hypothetical protein AN477_19475 [Alicyclobacillus ferrooxydans]